MSKKRKAGPQLYVHRPVKATAFNLTTSTAPNGQQRVYASASNVVVNPITTQTSPVHEPPPLPESGQTDFWSENGQIPHNPDTIENMGIRVSSSAKRYQNSVSPIALQSSLRDQHKLLGRAPPFLAWFPECSIRRADALRRAGKQDAGYYVSRLLLDHRSIPLRGLLRAGAAVRGLLCSATFDITLSLNQGTSIRTYLHL